MSKASNINSLAALRKRQREIAAEQKAAKQGLTATLAQAPAKAKEYALEDLALPALGVGLAFYAGYRLLRLRKSTAQVEEDCYPPATPAAAAAPPDPVRAVRPAEASPPPPPPPRENVQPGKKSLFNINTLLTAGKLLIPAAQAIIGVVRHQRSQQMVDTQAAQPTDPVEALPE